MRILHVNDYRRAGGCEILVDLTVRLQREAGHGVDLLVGAEEPGGRRTPLAYVDAVGQRRAVADRVRRFRPDVVHVHNLYHVLSPGVLAPLGAWRSAGGGALVMTAHDYHLVCPNAGLNVVRAGRLARADPARLRGLGYLLGNRWDHRGVLHSWLKVAQHVWSYRLRDRRRAIDLVVCPSRFVRDLVAPAVRRTVVIPNPGPERVPAGRRPAKPLRLVFVGRLEPEKGIDRMLEHLPTDFAGRLTVIGDGSRAAAVAAVRRRRGLEEIVELAGPLPHEAALAAIAASHVLVLPSVCYESSGLVLVEALAAGTNILTGRHGAMGELVADAGVGFTFDPDDPATLAAALRAIAAAHRAGTLNRFDVGAFLAERRPAAYASALGRAYATVLGPGAPTS